MGKIIGILIAVAIAISLIRVTWPISAAALAIAVLYYALKGGTSIVARSLRSTLQPVLLGMAAVLSLQLLSVLIDAFRDPATIGSIETTAVQVRTALKSVPMAAILGGSIAALWFLERRWHTQPLVPAALTAGRLVGKSMAVLAAFSSFTFFAATAMNGDRTLSPDRRIQAHFIREREALLAASHELSTLEAIRHLRTRLTPGQVTYVVQLIATIDELTDGSPDAARTIARWTAETTGISPTHRPDTFDVRDIRARPSEALLADAEGHARTLRELQATRDATKTRVTALLEQLFSAPKAAAKGVLKPFLISTMQGFVDADVGLVSSLLSDWAAKLLIDETAKSATGALAGTLAKALDARLAPPPAVAVTVDGRRLIETMPASVRVSQGVKQGTDTLVNAVQDLKKLGTAPTDVELAGLPARTRLALAESEALERAVTSGGKAVLSADDAARALRMAREARAALQAVRTARSLKALRLVLH